MKKIMPIICLISILLIFVVGAICYQQQTGRIAMIILGIIALVSGFIMNEEEP